MSNIEKDKNLLEAAFYSKPFYFSYSSLNRLLRAPKLFYKEYIMQEKEPSLEKHLLEGTLTHYLLLDNREEFDAKFLVLSENLPSENSLGVITRIFDMHKQKVAEDPKMNFDKTLKDYATEIDEILTEINLHQSVKDIEKRLAKIIEPKSEDYFEYLKKKENREIIDSAMLDRCSLAADTIKLDEKVRELLGMDRENDTTNFGIYNEMEIRMSLPDFPFGLKGIIDNMTVDVKAKLVRINDFKTSGKDLADFPDSVEYWNYWLQAVVYMVLVTDFLKEVIDDTWRIEINFIVCDKNNQIYAFPVSGQTLGEWIQRYNEVLKQAQYHYESKDYTLPYKFAKGEVVL